MSQDARKSQAVAVAFGGAAVLGGLAAVSAGQAIAQDKARRAAAAAVPVDAGEKDVAEVLEISQAVAAGLFGMGMILFFVIMLASAGNNKLKAGANRFGYLH